MSSSAFTRDEVILALDVLYSSEMQRVSADSEEIADLSALLNRLPIHPIENRRVDFRTGTGITAQLNRFRRSLFSGINKDNVGPLFFKVNFEFENRIEELHKIAKAIRRNEPYYSLRFGSRFYCVPYLSCGFAPHPSVAYRRGLQNDSTLTGDTRHVWI